MKFLPPACFKSQLISSVTALTFMLTYLESSAPKASIASQTSKKSPRSERNVRKSVVPENGVSTA